MIRIERQLARMRGRRVAVVGDAMLDEFLWGDATRISPEAPVPVVLLERRTWSLGGAANVAANIAALGGRPVLFAGLGRNEAAAQLRQIAAASGVDTGGVVDLGDRATTVKHRVFASNKHMLRFDQECTAPWPAAATQRLLRGLRATSDEWEAVVISDYAKGCVTEALVRGIRRLCRERDVPWCVDPKRPELRYHGATVLKPNLHELRVLSGMPIDVFSEVRAAAARVLKMQCCENLLVTRGRHGMALFTAAGGERSFSARGQAVSDVTGAGDTVLAVLGLSLAAGLGLGAAAALASRAAAYVVAQPGTAVATPAVLLAQEA